MRILFIATLHHPEVLQAAISATPPGQQPPLFPTSAAQHFWEKALKKRGHVLDVFYRNLPLWGGELTAQRYTHGWTLARITSALLQRVPAELNPDIRRRNQRLLEKARAFQPDWVWLVGDNTVITADTLATLKRELGCQIIYATGTSPIVFSHALERKAARLFDLVLVNDFYHGIQWLELGAKRMECLPLVACDPDFHHPYSLTDEQQRAFTCDIAFVGTLIPDKLYSGRIRALEALRDFDVGVWSVHDVPEALRVQARGGALGEDMLEVLSAAKLTINPHGDFMRYGGNMRLFEAAAVGVLQLTDDLPGVRRWFTPGETIVTYSNLDDLRAKARYYLNHEAEREALAQRAREYVYAHHTYEQRADRLEELIGG